MSFGRFLFVHLRESCQRPTDQREVIIDDAIESKSSKMYSVGDISYHEFENLRILFSTRQKNSNSPLMGREYLDVRATSRSGCILPPGQGEGLGWGLKSFLRPRKDLGWL